MGIVAVAGDWHGAGPWAQQKVAHVAEAGAKVLLHVGDFGIRSDKLGKGYLMGVEKACVTHDVTVLVTPGNHEDWSRINAKKAKDRGDGFGAVKWLTNHIGVLPRGHRFTLEGRSFVSLGGAPSVDKHNRTAYVNWWPEEAITSADVEAVTAGGHAEVMIAHDAPEGGTDQVDDIIASNPFGFPDSSLRYAAEGRMLMTQAFRAVAPKVFFHGHYHVSGRKHVAVPTPEGELVDGRDAWVVSLHKQHQGGNLAYLDLDTLTLV